MLITYSHEANEFAWLVEIMFEINRASGVNLGRQVQDCDGLQVFLRPRILDDPHLGRHRAEFIFHIIEHHDRATSFRNVLPELLMW